jgi:hypothetical protein
MLKIKKMQQQQQQQLVAEIIARKGLYYPYLDSFTRLELPRARALVMPD